MVFFYDIITMLLGELSYSLKGAYDSHEYFLKQSKEGIFMFRIGLSSKSNVFSEELFRAYKEADIRAVEISNCSDGYAAIDFDKIKRLADESGVTLWSFHLPFKIHDGIPHDISDPEMCHVAVEDHKKHIRIGAGIGIKIFVLHTSGPRITEEERPRRMEVCKQSLKELAEYAEQYGAVIALENMTHKCLGNTIAEFEELAFSHPALRVCFDTNHLLYESPGEFIRRMKGKIVTIHVSDCNLEVEQHKLPGEGKIKFDEIIAALKETGYTGPWLYEVSYRCPQPEDDKYKLTCESFVKNANELFAGKTPSKQR